MQEIYRAEIQPELVTERLREIRAAGVTVAGALTPQRTQQLWKTVVDAGVDLFVIRGTTVSAEHVSGRAEPLNLKRFIYELDVPVIVGGARLLLRGPAPDAHRRGRRARRLRRRRRAHHPTHARHPRADGVGHRRRRRRPPRLPRRVRRPLRARHRRRRHGHQRRHRQGGRLRRGCRDARRCARARHRRARPRLPLGPGGAPPRAAPRRAGRGGRGGRSRGDPVRARAGSPTARPTWSAPCGGRWRPRATSTSRSSSGSRSSSRRTRRS